jgi:hypothetical protein
MTRQHGLHERGFDVLSDAQIAEHRAIMSPGCIGDDIDLTRSWIAAARASGDEEALACLLTRAKGLQVCRRLLDGPEKCSKAPGSVMRDR